jgi:spore germination protein
MNGQSILILRLRSALIHNIDAFLDYVNNYFSSKKRLSYATIGYDWSSHFSAGLTSVYSLTLERAVDLAYITDSVIQFDEISQTPFYTYVIERSGSNITHIVWFIDARSINALLDLVIKYQLRGIGIWNITVYSPQLWLVINSQYEIEKII